MNDTFLIQIDRAEGSLQRLIGLVERRGFHIDGLTMADSGAHREIRLAVRGRDASRCVDVLGRQIDRLIGVRRIATQPAPATGRAAHVEGACPCPA